MQSCLRVSSVNSGRTLRSLLVEKNKNKTKTSENKEEEEVEMVDKLNKLKD